MYQVTQVGRDPIEFEELPDALDILLLQDIHYSPAILCDGETLVEVDYHYVPGVGIQSDGYVAKTSEAALHLKLAYARKIVSGKIDDACWNSVLDISRWASEATVGVIVRLDRKVAADAYAKSAQPLAGVMRLKGSST